MSICRPIITNEAVEEFLQNVVDVSDENEIEEMGKAIVLREMALSRVNNKSTMHNTDYRDRQYRTEDSREQLREQIFRELITLPRLSDDEQIRLGEGGALPVSCSCISGKQAYIIIGLPASGKSGIATKIAEEKGAIILDADYAKRKLPEFNREYGAALVHDESDAIIFGGRRNVFGYCVAGGFNMVIPKIGAKKEKIYELASELKEKGYSVHLVLVSVDRRVSTRRAYERYRKTQRYIPLTLIFDEYANEPTLTYYRIREADCFDTYGAIDTTGTQPKIMHESECLGIFC